MDIFVHVPGDIEQQRKLCDLLHIWRQIQKVHFIKISGFNATDLYALLLSTNFLFVATFTFPSPSFLPQNLHQPFSLNAGWVIYLSWQNHFWWKFCVTRNNTLTLLFSLLLNSNIEETYWATIILTILTKLFKSSGYFY